jgi:hypothetical protein
VNNIHLADDPIWRLAPWTMPPQYVVARRRMAAGHALPELGQNGEDGDAPPF